MLKFKLQVELPGRGQLSSFAGPKAVTNARTVYPDHQRVNVAWRCVTILLYARAISVPGGESGETLKLARSRPSGPSVLQVGLFLNCVADP